MAAVRFAPNAFSNSRCACTHPFICFAGSAIIFNQDGMQVAVVKNGVAHLRKSAVTADYGTEVEVNDGVKSGDQVILQPPVDLADGGNVQIIPEPPQPRRELIPRARERLPVRSGVAL